MNKTKFERSGFLHYRMTCIRVSMGLTVGCKTAKNLDNKGEN